MAIRSRIAAAALASFIVPSVGMYAQGRGAAPATPPAPRAMAPIDLTGYWVAVISEDWRWRMVTPAKGDYASIPLNVAGKNLADTWDPARDEGAGEQCKSYGAPGLMRAPTRLHITWLDDTTLKLETDYGMQTRLLQFRAARTAATAARIPEVDHDAPAPGLPAQERRALQHQHDIHGVLGRRPRAEQQSVARRHQYRGRPGESADPLGYLGPLQERARWREVGPHPLLGQVLILSFLIRRRSFHRLCRCSSGWGRGSPNRRRPRSSRNSTGRTRRALCTCP